MSACCGQGRCLLCSLLANSRRSISVCMEAGGLAPVHRKGPVPKDGVGAWSSLSMSSDVPLPQDFHSHLTRSEVVGYLGGRWDINSQSGY